MTCSDLVAQAEAARRPLSTRRGRVVLVTDNPAARSVTRKDATMPQAPECATATYGCTDCPATFTGLGRDYWQHVAAHRPYASLGIDGYTRRFATQAEAAAHKVATGVTAADLRVGDTFTDPYLGASFTVARTVKAKAQRQNITTTTGERFGYGRDAKVTLTARNAR